MLSNEPIAAPSRCPIPASASSASASPSSRPPDEELRPSRPRPRAAPRPGRRRCRTRRPRGGRGRCSCPGTAGRRRRRRCGRARPSRGTGRRRGRRRPDAGPERQHDQVVDARARRRASTRRARPAFASFSTATGRPKRSRRPSERDVLERDVDRAERDAGARGRAPTARRCRARRPVAARAARSPRRCPRAAPPASSVGVGTSCRSSSDPSRRSTPARIFVPPRSTPMTRWALTGRGYHNPAEWRTERSPTGSTRAAARRGRCRRRRAPSEPSPARAKQPGRSLPAGRAGAAGSGSPCSLLGVLLVVWLVASYLSFRSRRRGRERAAAEGGRANLAAQDGLLVSKPSLILLLGTDGDRTAARRRPPLRLDPARPHRSEAAPPGVPLDPARPPRRHPGHGPNKINAAFQLGGPALAMKTVQARSRGCSRTTS